MRINLKDRTAEFVIIDLYVKSRNEENIFKNNKKTLEYRLRKALSNPKDRLYKIAQKHIVLYSQFLNLSLGNFLLKLKNDENEDYKLYLNKYGDNKFCQFSIEKFSMDKGIYCFLVDGRVVYIGRSKNNFKERIKEYGKITAYNCLIDGQATNCNINSRINDLETIQVGFHLMNDSTNNEIEELEKEIIDKLKLENQLWNIQHN